MATSKFFPAPTSYELDNMSQSEINKLDSQTIANIAANVWGNVDPTTIKYLKNHPIVKNSFSVLHLEAAQINKMAFSSLKRYNAEILGLFKLDSLIEFKKAMLK